VLVGPVLADGVDADPDDGPPSGRPLLEQPLPRPLVARAPRPAREIDVEPSRTPSKMPMPRPSHAGEAERERSQSANASGGSGSRERVALHVVAAEAGAARDVSSSSAPSAITFMPERVGAVDDRAHDRVVALLGHPPHEALVDLQRVERQLVQAARATSSPSEVVDRDDA
jgi:hypothetical protein